MEEMEVPVGIILSGATTTEANCQLLKSSERGKVKEGMLLIVKSGERRILSRVSQIVPYNEFYTEGDPWSEARREGREIPESIARQYEICKLELLMEIPRKEISYPPLPGDKVLKINPKSYKYEEELFGVNANRRISDGLYKGIIKFGSLSGYEDLPITLDVENIPMHLAVFGVTGSGKSFTTGYLIEKLMEIPKDYGRYTSYPMIIVDAHGDYLDFPQIFKDKNNNEWMRCGWTRRYVFPKAYHKVELRKDEINPIGINLDLLGDAELAEMIVMYLKGSIEGAEQQISCLVNLIEELKYLGYSIHELIEDHKERDKIEERLKKYQNERSFHSTTIDAVRRQLKEFYKLEDEYKLLSTDSELKEEDFIDKITTSRGVAIIDFSAEGAPGVDLKTKQFIISYLAAILFEKFTIYKLQGIQKYLLFIIEEAQNFCPDKNYPIPSSLAQSKLSAIATQGRKFGLSLCLISQRPSFVDRIILSMCNTFFIHRVSPEDVGFVKSVSGGLPSSFTRRLTSLETGDVIVAGQMLTVPFPLLVKINKKDRKIIPSVGGTNVVDNL